MCGPTRTSEHNGERYNTLLIDDYFRMTWVTFFRENFESFEIFKVFKLVVENQVDSRIKCLRFDKGKKLLQMNLTIFVRNMLLGDIFLV